MNNHFRKIAAIGLMTAVSCLPTLGSAAQEAAAPSQGIMQSGPPSARPITGSTGFTREQIRMWMRDHKGEMRSLPAEQRKAYRHELRAKLSAMDLASKAKLQAQLQAEWNALPPKKQQRIEEHLAHGGGHSGDHATHRPHAPRVPPTSEPSSAGPPGDQPSGTDQRH